MAVEQAGGFVPSGRIVKGMVERLKERKGFPRERGSAVNKADLLEPKNTSETADPLSQEVILGSTLPLIPYSEGDVVLIRGMGNSDLRKFDGRWAIVLRINEYTVTVALAGKDVPVKPQFIEEVDPKYWTEIKAMHERISRLQQFELDLVEDAVLEVLHRSTCFTPKQMIWLQRMEQDYAQSSNER